MHVIVDGWRRNQRERSPWTEAAVGEFLARAVRHSGLTVIAGPAVKQFEGRIRGWAMIAESHIAVELDVMRDIAYTELFSCRDFDVDGFVHLAVTAFGLTNYRMQLIDRQLETGQRRSG